MPRRRARAIWLVILLVSACAGPATPPITVPPQPTNPPPPTPTATASASPGASAPTSASPSPTPSESVLPSPSGPATPAPSPTPALTVKSADGVVTVDVPDGAVPPGTTITVGLRPADQSPPELVTAGVPRTCYVLEPEGTTFSAPVKVTMTRPRDYYGDANSLPLLALATRSAAGAWEWLSDSVMWLTDEVMAVAGYTDHFSCLYDWSDRTDLKVNPGSPRTDKVGQGFSRTIEIVSRDTRPNPITLSNARFVNWNPDVIDIVADPGAPADTPIKLTRYWLCLAEGPYVVDFWADVNEFAADNPFWSDALDLLAFAGELYIAFSGVCTGEEGIVDTACIVVHHDEFGEFTSWLEFLLWLFGGYDVDYVEVTLKGANDEQPVRLDPVNEHFAGQLGLHNAGPKQLEKVLLHTTDGQVIDVTEEVKENLGDIVVRFPEEDTIGECR